MNQNERLYLIDKFNAREVERAAVVLAHGKQQKCNQDYKEVFAIQLIHTGFGHFPATIYQMPFYISAREVISIERYFGEQEQQHLPMPLRPISEVTDVKDYSDKRGIQVVGETDLKTFLEVFKLDVNSQLEDSLAKKLMEATTHTPLARGSPIWN